MIPIYLKKVEVRVASSEKPNLKKPEFPYISAKGLPEGADEFLTIGLKSHIPVGVYDMVVSMRSWEKSHFFDLLTAVPSAAK